MERKIELLIENSLHQFTEKLASQAPAPGGGGAAALSGALGAALLSMVCRLTIGKKGYEDAWAEMERIVHKTDQLSQKLLLLVDADAVAFEGAMAAFKMPKITEEEIAARKAAIEEGYIRANEPPIAIMRACLEVLRAAPSIGQAGNKAAISDVGVAVKSAFAALESASLNVKINLASIKNEDYRREIEAGMNDWITEGRTLCDAAFADVLQKI